MVSAATGGRVTHGRHCPCSACAREDWTRPDLAPCGMHGPDCPPVYAPIQEARVSRADATGGLRELARRMGERSLDLRSDEFSPFDAELLEDGAEAVLALCDVAADAGPLAEKFTGYRCAACLEHDRLADFDGSCDCGCHDTMRRAQRIAEVLARLSAATGSATPKGAGQE